MKKTIAMVFCFVAAAQMLALAQSNAVQVRFSSGSGDPGQNGIVLPLQIASPSNLSPASLGFDIEFDPAVLTFVGSQDGPATTLAGKSGRVQPIGGSLLRVLIFGLNDKRIDDGELMRFTWNIQLTAARGTTTLIRLRNLVVSDPNGASLLSQAVDGQIQISGSTASSCDQNNDGFVDIRDYPIAVGKILSNDVSFDLDCDGLPTVSDLQLLVNVIYGAACPTCGIPATTTTTSSTTTTLATTTTISTTTSSTTTTRPTTSTTTSSTTSTRPTTTTTTTTASTTTTLVAPTVGCANLLVQFNPNPAMDSGGGRHNYLVVLTETNGVGVILTGLRIGGQPDDLSKYFGPTRRVEAKGTLATLAQTPFPTPITSRQDMMWEFTGTDDLGHANLTWRGMIRMAPFSSIPYGHMEVEFYPNPTSPADDGQRPLNFIFSEVNGVGITLRGLTLGGRDVFFLLTQPMGPIPRVPPRTALQFSSANYSAQSPSGDWEWVFMGDDDNGHTGLTWSFIHRLISYVQLIDRIPQSHSAISIGFIPFQFSVYVPPDASELRIDLAGPASPRALNLYVRAGSPIGDTATYPPNPIADFSRANLGSDSITINAASSPPLMPGSSYYAIIYSSVSGQSLNYTITAVLQRTTSSTTTTSTTTASTTTTSSTTSSTLVSTTTSTSTSTSSTRTTTTTTTTTTAGATSTTSSSTTTTVPSRPPFAPNLVLTLSTLAAGSTPIVSFAFTQGPNELNVRSAELLISAGRLDLSNLTPGKTLGTASVKIPNSTLPEIPVSHVIVSNDGSNVRSEFRGSAYGQVVPIAEGLFQNTGSNGIRILITIKDKVQVLGTNVNLFPDGSTTGSNPLSVPFAVGDVFILPTPAGTPFTAITNFTSVNFPASGGTPSYQQRSQPFTAQ